MTKNGGYSAFESYDGKWLYYTKSLKSAIWGLSLQSGEESLVLDFQIDFRSWTIVNEGIYFLLKDENGSTAIRFFNFGTGDVSNIANLEDKEIAHISVSHDQRHFLYTQIDKMETDIILVENFR